MTIPLRQHIIFDFGAVLFQWRPELLFRQVLPLRATDEASARHLAALVFKGFTGAWGRFDAGLIERDELIPLLAEQAGLTDDEVAALVDAIPAHLQPLPDSVALLDELQAAGHRLFFLSNMPASYADYLERHQPLLQRFEDGVFSARVRLAKPDPAIFQLALTQFGVPASACVFMDDHLANVEAARALGLQAVHFSTAAQARLTLRELGVWRSLEYLRPDGLRCEPLRAAGRGSHSELIRGPVQMCDEVPHSGFEHHIGLHDRADG